MTDKKKVQLISTDEYIAEKLSHAFERIREQMYTDALVYGAPVVRQSGEDETETNGEGKPPAESADGQWLTFGDTLAALVLLSTRGIQGVETRPALKLMLLNLQRPANATTGALAELGISLYEE